MPAPTKRLCEKQFRLRAAFGRRSRSIGASAGRFLLPAEPATESQGDPTPASKTPGDTRVCAGCAPKLSATGLNRFKEEERLYPPELAAGVGASTRSLCSHGVAVWWWLCPCKRYYVNLYKALPSLHRIGGCLSSCALCSLQARGSAAATRSRVLLLHRSAEPRAERRAVRLPPRAPPGPALLGR